MMKRITLCLGIIAAIFVGSFFSLHFMDKNNCEIFDRVNEIERLYSEDSADIKSEIKGFEECWEKYYVRYSYYTPSATLDEVSYSVAKLSAIYENQSDEFIAECESIKYRVQRIYDRQFPHFHSIF